MENMLKNKITKTKPTLYDSMKKVFTIVAFALFLIASCLYISPVLRKARSQYHSSQLKKVVISDGNTERTDYVDSDGQITIAADKGYATITVTKISDGRRLEQYYDDKGEPISRYNGYYAMLLDYDENGNNTRITYLNYDGKPMIMANGYAIEKKEYNNKGQEIFVRYYGTEEEPILTHLYGYGKINEYGENGKICRIIYIDTSDSPMMIDQGYASITRRYYVSDGLENGKVESEFYFDTFGNPISLSLGQFGVHKEYDAIGRNNVLTYLDANGNPMITNKGYTTVIRTFQANNNVATEQYLDMEGKPFSLMEGQYGLTTTDGQTVYLDENGNEQFNVKNLLYNHSSMVIVVAMFLVLISVVFKRNWNLIFAVLYLSAIAYLTLLFREKDGATLRLEPLWSYSKLFTDSEARADILKNIWLFIPLGAILYRIYPNRKILLIPLGLSILIEIIQYISGIGFCELDDVISNTLGGLIGYEMEKLIVDIKNRLFRKQMKLQE